MKSLLRFISNRDCYIFGYVIILVILVKSPVSLSAFELYENVDSCVIDYWDLSLEENLKHPIIPTKISNKIKENMYSQYIFLKKKGYNVNLIRNNEVILIIIPIDNIFGFNSYDKMLQSGDKYMSPLIHFFRIKELYRIIFSVHHDNSLTSSDADFITNERVLYLTDWMIEKSENAKNIIPYSMGIDYPISTNSTKVGQKKNRRLEIFILPGKTMIELALENKL